MIDKTVQTMADALADLGDGAAVLVGGFGAVGQPDDLIEGLIERGSKGLTIIANNAGSGRVGLAKLIHLGRVEKIICSFPRSAPDGAFEELYRAGRIELEVTPQGTLAERLRAGGAGIPAFFTPTCAGTALAEGKETREFGGRLHVLETALRGDFALLQAWEGDRWGNLTYNQSGRNFNPVMAPAASVTVVQVQHLRELGAIPPEQVVTPSVYVQRIVQINRGAPWV